MHSKNHCTQTKTWLQATLWNTEYNKTILCVHTIMFHSPITNLPNNKTHHHVHFIFTENQINELDEIGKVVTVISAILLIPLIFTNLSRKDRRQYPSRATTLYMICVFGLHMTVIVGLFSKNRTTFPEFYETGKVSEFCVYQGMIYQFFACSTLWLWILICYILYSVIVKGTQFTELEKVEKYHHTFWLTLSIAQTAIPFYMSTSEPQIGVPVCWMSSKNHYFEKFYFFLLEMALCLFVGFIFMFSIINKLCMLRSRNNSGSANASSGSDVVDYITRHVLFIIFFIVVFTILTTCTIYEMRFSINHKNILPYFICVAHVSSACGIGIFTFCVFGTSSANRKVIFQYFKCCTKGNKSVYLKDHINSRSNHEDNEFDDLDYNHEIMDSNGYHKQDHGYEKL